MEMISNWELVAFGAACILVWGAIGAMFRPFSHIRFGREAVARPAPPEPPLRDIRDPATREGVERMLNRAGVLGEFEYRDGRVYLPVHPSRFSPLAEVLASAASFVAMQRNPNSISMYMRDSMRDEFRLVPYIDYDILREAASVMRSVAAQEQGKVND